MKPTLAQELAGKYSAREAAVIRRAARRCLAWWKAETGPGVTLTKSDAKFHIEGGGQHPAPRIEGAWVAVINPRINADVSLGVIPAGSYRAWYDGGAFQYRALTYSNDFTAATSGCGVFLGGGASFLITPITRDTPLEAQDAAISWMAAEDLLGNNVVSHTGGAILASMVDTATADNKWVNADSDTTAVPFYRALPPPRYGIIRDDVAAVYLPNTTAASYGGASWVSYPMPALSPTVWLYGETGFDYLMRWNITAYIPGKSASGDSDTFATYVERSGLGGTLITPDWTGTPFEMHTKTASIDVWHSGAGVDVPYPITAINIRYAPNAATHTLAYVQISLEHRRTRRTP